MGTGPYVQLYSIPLDRKAVEGILSALLQGLNEAILEATTLQGAVNAQPRSFSEQERRDQERRLLATRDSWDRAQTLHARIGELSEVLSHNQSLDFYLQVRGFLSVPEAGSDSTAGRG